MWVYYIFGFLFFFGFDEADVDDMQKLIYFDTDRTGGPIKIMSSSSLFSAVEDASSGKLGYKNSENFVERLARVRPKSLFFSPVAH